MKKTDRKPEGEMATNPNPNPTTDRRKLSYHKKQERSLIDKLILAVVGILAVTIIALSFHNTAALAMVLKLNPHLAACLVEMLFGSLLFIRARQRALQRNVPLFLDIGYFISLAFVTGVNMWGLGQIHHTGYVFGAAITGAMWLMENTLVWLWTDSHRPHEKSVREMKREVRKEIERARELQWIAWKRFELQKPDLALIKRARKAEREREKVVKEGLPYFFQTPDKQAAGQTNNQTDKQPNTEQTKQTDKQSQSKQTVQTKQTNKQTNTEQTEQTDKQIKQAPNKQDGIEQMKRTNEGGQIEGTKQDPEAEHQTDKRNPNTQTKQTTEQTDRQRHEQGQSEQTNIKRTPNKQDDNEQTNEHANQTPDKPNKQTDTEQTTEQVSELAAKQTNKQTPDKQTNNVVYIKQTNKKPTYEELLEMLDQYYKEKKDLPTVRAFAEQANVKPNRSYTAIKKWEKANGWEGKKKTANK